MADSKISALPDAGSLAGGEMIPATQAGGTVKITPAQIMAYVSGAPYLGQVATRAAVPNSGTTYKSNNSQTRHILRDAASQLRIAYANWYLANNGTQEVGSGGTVTYRAAIQIPEGSGSWLPFTWSGARDIVAADRTTTALSDALALGQRYPAGTPFLIRAHTEATAGVPIRGFGAGNISATFNATSGDQVEGSGSANGTTDKTTNGGGLSGSYQSIPPVLIVGQTSRPAVIGYGDSRMQGLGGAPLDVADSAGVVGNTFRSIEPHFAYLNCGLYGEKLSTFVAAGKATLRQALAGYFSHVVMSYGINDLSVGQTQAGLLADMAAASALFSASRGVVWNTIEPYTTSSDGWATVANQAPFLSATIEGYRVGANETIRAGGIAGTVGCNDVAAAVESGLNGGRFAVIDGQPLTSDGVHLNYYGNLAVRQRRAVDSARYRR